MNTLASPRGMHDLISPLSDRREWLERLLCETASRFGCSPIRTPLAEQLDLFVRSVGDATDIVEKEMYLLQQQGNQQLALRPENTAGCVRALLQHKLPLPQKLYYLGPMFRYERPQAGRYRQFHQFGVEYFGSEAPFAECEMLALCRSLWQTLGIAPQLQINFLGSRAERQAYNRTLVGFLEQRVDKLDADSQKRLQRNPLRILDSKDPQTLELLQQAPNLYDYLGAESKQRFADVQQGLQRLGIAFVHNPRMVRGLDYYNDLVFEWVSEDLGTQATVCAGGRYDQLPADLGGKPTPATGFALGLERLALIIDTIGKQPQPNCIDAVLLWVNKGDNIDKLATLLRLREQLPLLRIVDVTGNNLSKQLAKANKLNATMAFIIGEHEREQNALSIKYLREEKAQVTVPVATLANFFQSG